MLFYHSFCKPARGESPGAGPNTELSLDVLDKILQFGLLCRPEWLDLWSHPDTTLQQKQQARDENKPYDSIPQVRACFTLNEREGLTEKISLQLPSGQSVTTSHADVFGHFAIGVNSSTARSMGILPVCYYYDAAHAMPFGVEYVAGMSRQLVNRLDEVRVLLAVLAHVEALAFKDNPQAREVLLNRAALTALGIDPKFEDRVNTALSKLSPTSAAAIVEVFNTDRSPAWQIYDNIELLLSLYQTADSTCDGAVFGFFMQREWRLIHHKINHLKWFSLGRQPDFSDPAAGQFAEARNSMSRWMRELRAKQRKETTESYLKSCWVLAEMHNLPFRNYISELVVPGTAVPNVERMCGKYFPKNKHPRIVMLPGL